MKTLHRAAMSTSVVSLALHSSAALDGIEKRYRVEKLIRATSFLAHVSALHGYHHAAVFFRLLHIFL